MASLVLSFDGEMVQEYQITKVHMSIGRRPDNDIAIDNLAVSGSHAMIVRRGKDLLVEDSGSTNGTLVNGKAIEKHALQDGDVIEIGKFHLKYFEGGATHVESTLEKTMLIRSPFAGKQLDPEAPAIDTPTNVEPFPTTFHPSYKHTTRQSLQHYKAGTKQRSKCSTANTPASKSPSTSHSPPSAKKAYKSPSSPVITTAIFSTMCTGVFPSSTAQRLMKNPAR